MGFVIVAGDTLPLWEILLADDPGGGADPQPIDLTGATVTAQLYEPSGEPADPPTVELEPVLPQAGADEGRARKQLDDTITDVTGVRLVRYLVVFPGGAEQTFPTVGWDTLTVLTRQPGADVRTVRILAGEDRPGSTWSDADLQAVIDLTMWDRYVEDSDTPTPTVDPYAAAAEVWEQKAMRLAGDPDQPAAVTARSNGDVSESYAGGPLTWQGMLAMARRLRRRAHGGSGAIRTVRVLPPGELGWENRLAAITRQVEFDTPHPIADPRTASYVVNRPEGAGL